MKLAIRLDSKDNVATATEPIKNGETVMVLSEEGRQIAHIRVITNIPLSFHKIAFSPIAQGQTVIKYGETIGYASQPIDQGAWIHVHNLESTHLPEKTIREAPE